MRIHTPLSIMAPALVALALAACSDEPAKKRLGGTCGDDSDCAEGVCGGGICIDPSADDDADGLQNALEIAIGTNPVAGDTDNDGIGDKAELDQSLGLLDIDGDGTPDVLESATADGDGDCLPDQYDPDNAVANNDLTGLVPVVCRRVGVCAGATLAVACPGGPGTARCDYGAVSGFEAEEETCDGLDNDCDGATDEKSGDADDDGIADCEDGDDDGDRVDDVDDNCPSIANADQGDADGDDRGDACDPPAIPVVRAIAPGAIGNDTSPTVSGSCERGSTVVVHPTDTGGCDTIGPNSATCSDVDTFVIAVPVTLPLTRFAARATNAAGLESACAPSALDYTLDTIAPAAPTDVGLRPASPSPTANPIVSGNAEAMATLTFYTTSDCSGSSVGTGVATSSGAFDITIALPGDGAFSVYVIVTDRAGNRGACSKAIATEVVVATAAPASPVASAPLFTPPSPSPIAVVTVAGCAATGTNTTVFSGPCADAGVTTSAGSASCPQGMSPFGASLTMADDAVTAVYARSVSAAGVPSACTWLGSFTHDDTAPAAPVFEGVSPPSPSASPVVTITADTHGEAAFVWLTASCAGAPAGALLDGTTPFIVPQNQTFTVYARTVDAAGNGSACTSLFTYTHDAQAPVAPSLHPTPLSPASPSQAMSTTLSACTTGNAVVSVFATPGCTGAPRATLSTLANDPACPNGRVASGTVLALANDTIVLSGRATSATGVHSGCAYLGSYRNDTQAPAAPTFTSVAPVSPSRFRIPRVAGTAEAGARVDIHDGSCAGTVRGAAIAGGSGAWSASVDLPAVDGVFALFGRATDAAGNTACAALTSYEVDTAPPLPPTGIGGKSSGPTFPDVMVGGCAEPGLAVDLSLASDCSITAASTTASASDQACPSPPARGTFGASITVAPDTMTLLYASARDAAGNRSACVVMDEVYWDTVPPGQPSVTGTRAVDWSMDLTFEIDGVVVSADTRTVRVYEVPDTFAGGPCPGDPIGAGTSDGVTFHATATVDEGAERAIAVQAVDGQGNTSACGSPRPIVLRSTATAVVPDAETRSEWVPAEGGHIFWHYPDGQLAAYMPIGVEEPVPSAFTFEGMFATVGLTKGNDGYDTHFLGSYSLAAGEDVAFELGELDEPGDSTAWPPYWPLYLSIQAPPDPCQDCAYFGKEIVLACGDRFYFNYESSWVDIWLYPECMQDFVCHAVDELGYCIDYDFSLDMILTMSDWNNELAYYVVPPTQRFDENDVEISISFAEGLAWRDDFDEVDVTVTNATGEPRGSQLALRSVWRGRDLRLQGRDLQLIALPAMPAVGTTKLIPGLGEGTTSQLVKFLTLGNEDGESNDGLTATVQTYQRRVGPAPTELVYAQDEMLPFVLPVAMPDYADPDRPVFELYTLGDRTAEVSVVMFEGSHRPDTGSGDDVQWSFVMSGDRPFMVQYPEFPASMPWLGFSDYQDDFGMQFVNIDFDFTFGWEDARAFFGWRLLTLFGGDAPLNLPDEFGFDMSFCCGGMGRRGP